MVLGFVGRCLDCDCGLVKINLESIFLSFYLSGMKNLKISDGVHKELKIFSANHPNENMSDVAGFSILKYLKTRKHQFSTPMPAKDKISNKIKKSKP